MQSTLQVADSPPSSQASPLVALMTPNGPYVGPSALGSTVLGTSGRADGFGNESWGAEYGAELSLRGVTGGPHGNETVVRGELVGRATVYDISADVVRIVLDGTSAADGKAEFDANLSILDRYTYPLFSYEGNFSDEKRFSAQLLTATTGVPLVPGLAPVEVNASIVGSMGYLVSGQILPKGIAILVRPEASVLATATAQAGVGNIASARVEGQLELITISVPIQAALTFDEKEGIEFRWDVRVDMDADWLGGDIEVIATALGQDRYRKSLAEFEGYHLSTTHLSNGAGEIFPGAPGNCGASELQADRRSITDALQMPAPVDAGSTGSLDALLVAAPALGQSADLRHAAWLQTSLAAAIREDAGQIERLAESIDGPDPVSVAMIGALEENGTAQARAALVELAEQLESSTDVQQRVLLLQVLGNVGADQTQDVVAQALADARPEVRKAAVVALRHVPTPEADAWLRQAMTTDADVEVRAAAVRVAGARDTEDAHRAVADLVQREEDDWVQFAALHALGRIVTRSESAAEALRWLEAHGQLEQTRVIARNYLHRLDVEAAED